MAPGAVRVALGRNGVPVTDPLDVAGWSRRDAVISASVTFGPYAERVDATDVLVWVGGEGPDPMRLSGDLGLPPGVPFVFDLDLGVSG
jgi:hypothetical protein